MWKALSIVVLTLASATSANAAAKCGGDYKVLSASWILVRCDTDIAAQTLLSGHLYSESLIEIPATLAAFGSDSDPEWIAIHIVAQQGNALAADKTYRLTLSLTLNGVGPVPAEVSLKTAVVMAATPAGIGGAPRRYNLVSNIGILDRNAVCGIQVQNYEGKPSPARLSKCDPGTLVPENVDQNFATHVDPMTVGHVIVEFRNDIEASQQIPFNAPTLPSVFGRPFGLDAKSRFNSPKAPASKDGSQYYININYAAGPHAKPAWVLDAKIAPQIGGLHRGFQFAPQITTDVGQNQISGLTYSDKLNFGATFTRLYTFRHVLHGLSFAPSAVYETDKEFDRHNLLAAPDLTYHFAGLYKTRQIGTLQEFAKREEKAREHGITLQPEDVHPVLFGYALDFHSGFETGGALKDTTVSASSGKAKQLLPSYSIFRIVPQVHGLLEIGPFSIDVTGTGRYLATSENTVIELTNHTLALKRVSGWQGYGVVQGSWAFDPAGHFALTVSYKNGFLPPKYNRVNAVQSGILMKF